MDVTLRQAQDKKYPTYYRGFNIEIRPRGKKGKEEMWLETRARIDRFWEYKAKIEGPLAAFQYEMYLNTRHQMKENDEHEASSLDQSLVPENGGSCNGV